MPTYEYKCTKCEEIFEIFQKITDASLRECPVCGGDLNKVISGGIGVIFKGSGFYTTDYKGSGSNITGSASSKTPSKDGEKSSGAKEEKKSVDTSSINSK